MSSQQGGNTSVGTAAKARSRPTRQAAQQHKYADMKQDVNVDEEELTPVRFLSM